MKKNNFLITSLILAFSVIVASFIVKNLPKKIEASPSLRVSNHEQVINFPFPDFGLDIPKISVQAPIVAEIPGDDKDAYFKALERGLAHFQGTSRPGEGELIFIFGHSSFYPWAKGDYKETFKDLDQMKQGDEFTVWYRKKAYEYKVKEVKIVEPNDLTVLAPTSKEILTLMTCYPPGLDEKRLIVNSEPIDAI